MWYVNKLFEPELVESLAVKGFLVRSSGGVARIEGYGCGADLRSFNEELRTALGVPTYYNEALGSTCQFSVYDRVKGRAGDVPDESVGVRDETEH
jgi:hypothetical protein